VLEVVEHEECLLVCEKVSDLLPGVALLPLRYRKCPRHGRRYEAVVDDRFERDEVHAVAKRVHRTRDDLEGETGLPSPAGPDQRQQAPV
jgi:hypothetical protein